MAEIASPISGGIQAVRRTVSSSIFTGAGVVQGSVDNSQQIANSRLLTQNSLQLSVVTDQLGGIASQVSTLNNSLQVLTDNLAIQGALDRQREQARLAREATLAEQGLREGKENAIENKIRNALLSPVERIGRKLQGILGRVTGFLGQLFVGFLTSSFITTMNSIVNRNFGDLRSTLRNTAKILLAVGGIVLISKFGVGGIIGGLFRFGRNLKYLNLKVLLSSPFRWLRTIGINILKWVKNLVPWIVLGTPMPGESVEPPSTTGDSDSDSDGGVSGDGQKGDVQPGMMTDVTNQDLLTDIERKRPKRDDYVDGSEGDTKFEKDLASFKNTYDDKIRDLTTDQSIASFPEFDPTNAFSNAENAIVRIGKDLYRLNDQYEIEGKYEPFEPPATITAKDKKQEIITPINKREGVDKNIGDSEVSGVNINVVPIQVEDQQQTADGSRVDAAAIDWPVIKATNSFNTYVWAAYQQFNVLPVTAS
tara:strand:+ start:4312 stop:5748 length:1437 start_codon:yes stop_codon:yes gene_type:complete